MAGSPRSDPAVGGISPGRWVGGGRAGPLRYEDRVSALSVTPLALPDAVSVNCQGSTSCEYDLPDHRVGLVRRGQLLDPAQAAAGPADPGAGDARPLGAAPDDQPAGPEHHRRRGAGAAAAAARAGAHGHADDPAEFVPERRRQRAEAIGSVLRSFVTAFVFGIALLMILRRVQLRPRPAAGQRRHRRRRPRLRRAEPGQGPDRRPVHAARGPVRRGRHGRPGRGDRRRGVGRAADHHGPRRARRALVHPQRRDRPGRQQEPGLGAGGDRPADRLQRHGGGHRRAADGRRVGGAATRSCRRRSSSRRRCSASSR